MARLKWILILILILLPTAIASACPNCKESIPNSDAAEAASLPGGFNASVYYMLGGLFVTLGLVLTVITKGVRSATRMPKT